MDDVLARDETKTKFCSAERLGGALCARPASFTVPGVALCWQHYELIVSCVLQVHAHEATREKSQRIGRLDSEISYLEARIARLSKRRKALEKGRRESVIATFKFRCFYCKRKGNRWKDPDGCAWHIDHVVPVVLGGGDDSKNLALACQLCNLRKGARTMSQFLMSGEGF